MAADIICEAHRHLSQEEVTITHSGEPITDVFVGCMADTEGDEAKILEALEELS